MNQAQKASWEEGIARRILERAGEPETPIDAFAVADALGFEVRFVGGTKGRLERATSTILVPNRVRPSRQHLVIMHELAHDSITSNDVVEMDAATLEAAAWYAASAAMLPRRPFLRDLAETDWNLDELRAKHVNCSAEVIARRICAVDDAVVTVWDQGKFKHRVPSPWLSPKLLGKKPSAFESELAARVLETGDTQHAGPRLWGFPVYEGNFRRVITVCEAEQLGLRY